MLRFLASIGFAFLCAACVATPPPAPNLAQIKFDPAASAYVLTKGTGSIEGQAYVRSVSGGVIPATRSRVILVPVTAYHEARLRAIYGTAKTAEAGSIKIPNPPAAFAKYQRVTTADAQGRFTFEDVAPGSYFIITSVRFQDRSIGVYERVTVAPDTLLTVAVSGA